MTAFKKVASDLALSEIDITFGGDTLFVRLII